MDKAVATLKAHLEAMPGVTMDAYTPPRATEPLSLMYKVGGKMFAVLAVRGEPFVVVKCDPALAVLLREQYKGAGQRTHLDPRHWVSLDLDADVPANEIKQLSKGSYDLIRAGLTRKQQEALAGR